MIEMSIDGGERTIVPIEIKTYSATKSYEKAQSFAATEGLFVCCDYGDSTFVKAIPIIGYRIQVLHHAMVMKSEKVLFITAQRNGVIFMLLINIPSDIREIYKDILLKFVCTSWSGHIQVTASSLLMRLAKKGWEVGVTMLIFTQSDCHLHCGKKFI